MGYYPRRCSFESDPGSQLIVQLLRAWTLWCRHVESSSFLDTSDMHAALVWCEPRDCHTEIAGHLGTVLGRIAIALPSFAFWLVDN